MGESQKAPPLAGELSVNDSEQTEGEYLTALGFFESFPFRHFVPLSPQAGTAFGLELVLHPKGAPAGELARRKP
ncbi:MAG: hypothetical protein DBX62_02050 [Clostridia bacterium]|nr:MAG: hypothetical protein DBX62_02050 [Clostridia bacterium]